MARAVMCTPWCAHVTSLLHKLHWLLVCFWVWFKVQFKAITHAFGEGEWDPFHLVCCVCHIFFNFIKCIYLWAIQSCRESDRILVFFIINIQNFLISYYFCAVHCKGHIPRHNLEHSQFTSSSGSWENSCIYKIPCLLKRISHNICYIS